MSSTLNLGWLSAAALRRDAVHRLRDAGYPVEAVAQTLGVTRQRAQQLDAREKVA